jgi:hypothetical protein
MSRASTIVTALIIACVLCAAVASVSVALEVKIGDAKGRDGADGVARSGTASHPPIDLASVLAATSGIDDALLAAMTLDELRAETRRRGLGDCATCTDRAHFLAKLREAGPEEPAPRAELPDNAAAGAARRKKAKKGAEKTTKPSGGAGEDDNDITSMASINRMLKRQRAENAKLKAKLRAEGIPTENLFLDDESVIDRIFGMAEAEADADDGLDFTADGPTDDAGVDL